IFDLDGTLLWLQVDWREARTALRRIARRFGRASEGVTIWAMLREASGKEAAALREALCAYEVEGSRHPEVLPSAALLPHLERETIGVVTLNCRAAAEGALRATDLWGDIGALVAREDTSRLKPDPEPLLLCVEKLGGASERAVFVGDRDRDRETAKAAGTAFLSVEDLLA
ncbi:MAG: HAD family phosphatase, partial [Thermoplasmata archaeon]|nr:HAD family phosphatase [Thermoplasmata archaeon]